VDLLELCGRLWCWCLLELCPRCQGSYGEVRPLSTVSKHRYAKSSFPLIDGFGSLVLSLGCWLGDSSFTCILVNGRVRYSHWTSELGRLCLRDCILSIDRCWICLGQLRISPRLLSLCFIVLVLDLEGLDFRLVFRR